MIIIVEPDKDIKKKLCDLLVRERVVGVVAIPDLLEALCRFQSHIDVIVVNAVMLNELFTNQVLTRLCNKLAIRPPPVLGYFTNGQRPLKQELERTYPDLGLLQYDEQRKAFPDEYVAALRRLFPAVNVELEKARKVWQDETGKQELVDIGRWLEEEGFIEGPAQSETKPAGDSPVQPTPVPPVQSENGYEELYFELKKKHEELLRYVAELVRSVENPEPGSSQPKPE